MTDTTFPTLPQGYKRFSVEQLLIELAPALGLRGGRLHALLYMMKHTAPAAWTDPACEPVFYAAQDQTAAALHKTRRALYSDEKALEKLGLIEKRVKGNGSRSPYGGCGIVFSKLIGLVPELLRRKEQMADEQRQRKDLRNRRSTYLRHVKRYLEYAAPPALRDERLIRVIEEFQAWPASATLVTISLDALETHVSEAQMLCSQLDEFLEDWTKTSGKPEQNFPCHIQENSEKTSFVSCTAKKTEEHVDAVGRGKAQNCIQELQEKILGQTDGAADVARDTKIAQLFDPERLFALASVEMQGYIRACRDDGRGYRQRHGRRHPPRLRDMHFIDAATRITPALGINHDAWIKAVHAMGDHGAALCVLIIDANRSHPTPPIRNPGGVLRAMTERYRAGTLNLVGSLIGLAKRRDGRG